MNKNENNDAIDNSNHYSTSVRENGGCPWLMIGEWSGLVTGLTLLLCEVGIDRCDSDCTSKDRDNWKGIKGRGCSERIISS